jgi:uncharacterized damage-inducible protein DinB
MADSSIALARPLEGNFNPQAAEYVSLAPAIEDAVGQLAVQRDAVLQRFSGLTDQQAAFRYGADKWTVRQVLGHICDAERVFAYRLLRIGRGDETPLPGFDENAYVPAAEFESRKLTDLMEEWTAVRNATIALVGGLPPAAWTRRGTASGKPITTAALAYIILGHVEHHLKILAERYDLR